MIRYLLDTNAMGDLINRRRCVDDRVREARVLGAVIGTCEPVVAELFFGVENSASRDENLRRLKAALARVKCWPFDRNASQEYGRLATQLKRTGRPMEQIDIMVAAIAISLGNCTVVSADKDLNAVRGLTVKNWAS